MKKVYSMPKCPKCGGKVVLDEVVDTNFYGDGTYVDTCVGDCEKCGTSYFWEDTYTFHHRGELQPTKE